MIINIAVCDDEQESLDWILKKLHKAANNLNITIETYPYMDGSKVVNLIYNNKEDFNILFLDIDMPNISGLEVAKKLRKKEPDIILIIVLIQMLIYKIKIWLSFLLTLIYSVILAAIDFMTAYFTAFLLDTEAGYLLNVQSLTRVLCILLSKSLLLFIIITLRNLFQKTLIFIKKYVVIMCIIFYIFINFSFSYGRT